MKVTLELDRIPRWIIQVAEERKAYQAENGNQETLEESLSMVVSVILDGADEF